MSKYIRSFEKSLGEALRLSLSQLGCIGPRHLGLISELFGHLGVILSLLAVGIVLQVVVHLLLGHRQILHGELVLVPVNLVHDSESLLIVQHIHLLLHFLLLLLLFDLLEQVLALLSDVGLSAGILWVILTSERNASRDVLTQSVSVVFSLPHFFLVQFKL